MADIEKVIKGLESCTGSVGDCDEHCPYFENCDDYEDGCRIEMERNALALLKEQEAVVRCKDCKYYNPTSGECYRHHFVVYFSNGNWFCADGEAKE